jgi:hypothetical protein
VNEMLSEGEGKFQGVESERGGGGENVGGIV